MKIVICGGGQVGFNIARHLTLEGSDVVVIDTSPELIAGSTIISMRREWSVTHRGPTYWNAPVLPTRTWSSP